MKPVTEHRHHDPAIAPIRGARLEVGDVMLPGDAFASKRDGWKHVHANWHGVALLPPAATEEIIVRPESMDVVAQVPPSPAPRGRLLKRHA
jgi:hypothetical protein